jgi:inhibitor of KinA sporulation pathway (predicted exonuclease)
LATLLTGSKKSVGMAAALDSLGGSQTGRAHTAIDDALSLVDTYRRMAQIVRDHLSPETSPAP